VWPHDRKLPSRASERSRRGRSAWTVLNYTSLFSDLEGLYEGAGQDPSSFRRLEREVRRVRESLEDYTREVSEDYVLRLEARLSSGDARLSADEVELLRAYLGVSPADPQADQHLVEDLRALETEIAGVISLRDQPLRLRNLEGLRRRLGLMEFLLPGLILILEERNRRQRFEEAAGLEEGGVDAAWLLAALSAARGEGELPDEDSEETGLSPFSGR
jgi:hypothetical protein